MMCSTRVFWKFPYTEAVARRCSVKKVFLEIAQKSQENTCAQTLAQVFSCEFREISKNTFSYRTSPVPASVYIERVNSQKILNISWP